MNGQRQIIAARLQGMKPTAVFLEAGLETLPAATKYDDLENGLMFGAIPTVHIPASEMGQPHDLRFLTGLRVHVHGMAMSDEFLKVVERVAEVASHVVAIADSEIIEYQNGDWKAYP